MVGPSKIKVSPNSSAAFCAPLATETKYGLPLALGSRPMVSFLAPLAAGAALEESAEEPVSLLPQPESTRPAVRSRTRIRFMR